MPYNFSRLQVGIVDGSLFSRRVLRTLLSAIGVPNGSIREMADAETALADLEHFLPDILLCEVTLPGMDGIKFVEAVRQLEDETKRYLPIIMCTAHTEQHRVLACRDAGAHEVLNKPMSVSTLYQRIVSVIERPRSFVYSPVFAGPDRRRSTKEIGKERRSGEE